MVASAVLGAATGTGLALLVAMTLVVYRYYASRRYGKDWGDVERFSVPHSWQPEKGYGGAQNKKYQRAPTYAVNQKSAFEVQLQLQCSRDPATVKLRLDLESALRE